MSLNLTHRQSKVVEALKLDLRKKSPKGWIIGATCPFCNRSDKFGIKLNDRGKYRNHVSYNCFHGNCQAKGSEFGLLKHLGLLHLIIDGEFIGNKESVENRIKALLEEELDIKVIKRHLPFGFKRVYQNDYLESRGFEPWQFQQYHIGETKLDHTLKNYIIFSITEDDENKGYVARIQMTGEQIKLQEQTTGKDVLRYKNEGGVDFAKLVYGIEEITPLTTKIILVEGVTSKAGVDRLIRQMNDVRTVCLCTFGKKISEEQITKIWLRTNNRPVRIIVLYDPDAVDAVKNHGYTIKIWFDDIKIGYLYDKDPGDLKTVEELQEILDNLQSLDQFGALMLQPKKLK